MLCEFYTVFRATVTRLRVVIRSRVVFTPGIVSEKKCSQSLFSLENLVQAGNSRIPLWPSLSTLLHVNGYFRSFENRKSLVVMQLQYTRFLKYLSAHSLIFISVLSSGEYEAVSSYVSDHGELKIESRRKRNRRWFSHHNNFLQVSRCCLIN